MCVVKHWVVNLKLIRDGGLMLETMAISFLTVLHQPDKPLVGSLLEKKSCTQYRSLSWSRRAGGGGGGGLLLGP